MLESRYWKVVGADKGNIKSSQESWRLNKQQKKPSEGDKRAH